MSTKIIPYKVIWVDDDPTIVDGMIANADEYGLELQHFENWNEAKKALLSNFAEYSAIILDAFCKKDSGKKEEEIFITSVLPELTKLFGERNRAIPWYILSAGTMRNFNFVIESAESSRHEYSEDWGDMLYLKDVPDDSSNSSRVLFKNIQSIAPNYRYNIILSYHSNVFKYLGKGKLIDSRARKHLMKMLDALYFPEENPKFEFVGNPLRKIIEYLFRAAKNVGLLPNECFDGDEIKLQLASLFLAGNNVSYDRKNKERIVRWGKQGENGNPNDQVFPQDISEILKYILNLYVNPDSHTSENEPFLIDEQKKELFFGCVLQICHVIKWFGAYVESHPDKEKNKSMHHRFERKDKCKAEEKTLETDKPKTPKPVPKTIVAEDIIGKIGTVLNGNKGMYVQAAAKCKVHSELKPQLFIGKSVTVEAVEPYTGKDAEEYPFIIIRLSQQ